MGLFFNRSGTIGRVDGAGNDVVVHLLAAGVLPVGNVAAVADVGGGQGARSCQGRCGNAGAAQGNERVTGQAAAADSHARFVGADAVGAIFNANADARRADRRCNPQNRGTC